MKNDFDPQDSRLNPRMFEAERLKRCQLEECFGACCVFGVWADPRERDDILAHAEMIQPFMCDPQLDPEEWFAPIVDEDPRSPSGKVVHTAVETAPWHYGGTACVFCHEDGKCTLQLAAVANQLHPWRFKPYYCILHPLDLDEQGKITLDTREAILAEKGSCLRSADEPVALIETFAPELEYLLGTRQYIAAREYLLESKKQKGG